MPHLWTSQMGPRIFTPPRFEDLAGRKFAFKSREELSRRSAPKSEFSPEVAAQKCGRLCVQSRRFKSDGLLAAANLPSVTSVLPRPPCHRRSLAVCCVGHSLRADAEWTARWSAFLAECWFSPAGEGKSIDVF